MNRSCLLDSTPIFANTFLQFYSLLYGIPTTILYILISYCFRRQSNYYSIIYAELITVSSICNVACWWLQFIFGQLIGYSPLCNFVMTSLSESYYPIPLYFLYASVPVANFVSCCSVCVYQMLAVILPMTFEQGFKRRLKIFYIFLIFIPIICSFHVLIGYTTFFPLSTSRIYVRVDHYFLWLDFMKISTINAIVGCISLAIIILCSLVAVVRFFQIRKKNNGTIKFHLFITNVYICLSTIIYIIYQILLIWNRRITANNEFLAILYSFRALVSDICYLPIPWVILLVNKRLRDSTISLFGRKQTKIVSPLHTSFK